MAITLLNLGTAGVGNGETLRDGGIKINALITESIRIGMEQITASPDELNLLSGVANMVPISEVAIPVTQIDAALTDNTPLGAEINAALGVTAVGAGKNYTRIIKDTTGTGLLYLCASDGTDWFYVKFTKAV